MTDALDEELPPLAAAPKPAPKPAPAPVAAPAPARAKLGPSGADVRDAVLNQIISTKLKTQFAAIDADDASWLIAALVSSACEEKIGRIAGDMQQRVSLSLTGTDSASLKMLFADVVDERVGSAVHAAVKGSVGLAVDKSIDRHFAGLVDSQNDRFASLSKSISKICGEGGAGPGVDLAALERTVERAVERRPAGGAAVDLAAIELTVEKAVERAIEKGARSEIVMLAMLSGVSALAGFGIGSFF